MPHPPPLRKSKFKRHKSLFFLLIYIFYELFIYLLQEVCYMYTGCPQKSIFSQNYSYYKFKKFLISLLIIYYWIDKFLHFLGHPLTLQYQFSYRPKFKDISGLIFLGNTSKIFFFQCKIINYTYIHNSLKNLTLKLSIYCKKNKFYLLNSPLLR